MFEGPRTKSDNSRIPLGGSHWWNKQDIPKNARLPCSANPEQVLKNIIFFNSSPLVCRYSQLEFRAFVPNIYREPSIMISSRVCDLNRTFSTVLEH